MSEKYSYSSATSTGEKRVYSKVLGKFSSFFIFAFGFILPLITLIVELSTEICAESFFNPIPTPLHIALVAVVPLTGLLLWLRLRKQDGKQKGMLEFLSGLAIGSSLFYSLIFLPMTPLAVVAIIIYGMGFLPLSPLLALIAMLVSRFKMRRIYGGSWASSKVWLAMSLALALLIGVEMPEMLTQVGLQLVASETGSTRQFGLDMLRRAGSRESLLRSCYQRPLLVTGMINFLFSLGDPVRPEQAREIYYQVTGEPFNTFPPPKFSGHKRWMFEDEFDFDFEQGGTFVAGRLKGLYLTNSQIEGSIDPDAATSYFEWTMVFKNESQVQREARAQVILPPGGVVSRLTLWVNGEEREAAFAERGKVRQAYSQVVSQRRDPVLVTTDGDGKVFVQCFPVTPNGGEMKIRLGISSPLEFESKEKAFLQLPKIAERNYTILAGLQHRVKFEADRPISSNVKLAENGNAVEGLVKETDLINSAIFTTRPAEVNEVWAEDLVIDKDSPTQKVVKQTIKEEAITPISQLVFVIDGSVQMKPFVTEVAKSLAAVPDYVETAVLLASDKPTELLSLQTSSSKLLTERVSQIDCVGGQDNAEPLLQALKIASQKPDSRVVWIHATQPVVTAKGLSKLAEWPTSTKTILYDLQVVNGPNKLTDHLSQLNLSSSIKAIPRLGSPSQDLAKLLSRLFVDKKEVVLTRERLDAFAISKESRATKETSAHIARLWAQDEVMRYYRLNQRDEKLLEKALKIAVSYQLVTPISGAVVLETREQYERAGLEPVPYSSVPTIPEPETWMLIIAAGLILIVTLYLGRRRVETF
ncbi:MAG: hypothetical protein JNN15_06980 [Blastocatellia bacterium]|nr:hypothetical protein [Blastocatellia bacterium]